jgi:organic radical activating enzyme
VITGGEPLLQVDSQILSSIKELGMELHLETNGSLAAERILSSHVSEVDDCLGYFSEITVSPKVVPLGPNVLELATSFKVLIPFPVNFNEGDLTCALNLTTSSLMNLIVQPQTPAGGVVGWEWRKNVNEALAFSLKRKQLYGETWRVIPQTHIIMRVR